MGKTCFQRVGLGLLFGGDGAIVEDEGKRIAAVAGSDG